MMVYVNPNMPAIFEACHIAIMVAIEAGVVVAVVVAVVVEVAVVQLVLLLVLLLLQLVEHFGFVVLPQLPNTLVTTFPILARDIDDHNPALGSDDILFAYNIFKYYNPIENKIAMKDITNDSTRIH